MTIDFDPNYTVAEKQLLIGLCVTAPHAKMRAAIRVQSLQYLSRRARHLNRSKEGQHISIADG